MTFFPYLDADQGKTPHFEPLDIASLEEPRAQARRPMIQPVSAARARIRLDARKVDILHREGRE